MPLFPTKTLLVLKRQCYVLFQKQLARNLCSIYIVQFLFIRQKIVYINTLPAVRRTLFNEKENIFECFMKDRHNNSNLQNNWLNKRGSSIDEEPITVSTSYNVLTMVIIVIFFVIARRWFVEWRIGRAADP